MRTSCRVGLCIGFLVLPNLVFAATYLGEWGAPGSGPGQFDLPTDVAVASNEVVYVADSGNQRVQYFDPTGQYLGQFGSFGTGPGQFLGELSLDLDFDRNVYVLREGAPEVGVFTESGTYLRSFGSGLFSLPLGITVGNSMEFVFVADTGNDRVVMFALDGTQLTSWGGTGSGPGQFDQPVDLVEYNGLLFVLDKGNDRVQAFDLGGNYVDEWGATGSGDGQFDAPEGIGVAWGGDVYVADTGNQRVQRFRFFDNLVEAWGEFGTGPGQFDGPIAVDSFADFGVIGKRFAPNLYVVDQGNARVQVFEGPCVPGFEPNVQVSSAGGHVFITPGGNGPRLSDVGATITVTVLDNCDDPIPGYPFQDIWWDDVGNGDLSMCQGGSVADGNTDGAGTTTIGGAAFGGGFSQAGVYVYLAGLAIVDSLIPLEVNSPDLSGDRVVNLVDVGDFAADFHNGEYDFRSDLARDGVENLADIGVLAMHMGETCP